MKIQTIKKYIGFLESMLDSDATSLKDYCNKYGINYSTFNVQLAAIKKEVRNYYEECTKEIELWEQVKKHFAENRRLCKSSEGITSIAKSNIKEWDGKEPISEYNDRVLAEIDRLHSLLITEDQIVLTPEISAELDENYWDEL